MQDNSKLSKIFFKLTLKKYHCKSNQLECFREHLNHVGHFIDYNVYGMDLLRKNPLIDTRKQTVEFLFLVFTHDTNVQSLKPSFGPL